MNKDYLPESDTFIDQTPKWNLGGNEIHERKENDIISEIWLLYILFLFQHNLIFYNDNNLSFYKEADTG